MLSRILFVIVSLLPTTVTHAFPGSIGSCLPGKKAIQQGAHANLRQVDKGGSVIGNAGFELYIDGRQVYEDVKFDFTAGDKHSIQLKATADIMRGFLLRLESLDGQDTRDALSSTDSQVQIPFFCTDVEFVGGMSHNGRDSKTSIEGTFYMAKPSEELALDVTTVVTTIYSYGIAEWYVSQFKLRAVAQGTAIVYTTGTTTSATSTQCLVGGTYCAQDGSCCSGRCIREDTQNTWAAGTCLDDQSHQQLSTAQISMFETAIQSTSTPTSAPVSTAKPSYAPEAITIAPTRSPTLGKICPHFFSFIYYFSNPGSKSCKQNSDCTGWNNDQAGCCLYPSCSCGAIPEGSNSSVCLTV